MLDEDAGPFDHAVWRLGGPLFGIHRHANPSSSERCDELRPGLDHVAFGCANRAKIEQPKTRPGALGIAHAASCDAHYGSGLSSRGQTPSP